MIPLVCGACNGELFRTYEQDTITGKEVIVECEKCLSTTIVRAASPKLVLIWGQRSEGMIKRKGK